MIINIGGIQAEANAFYQKSRIVNPGTLREGELWDVYLIGDNNLGIQDMRADILVARYPGIAVRE